MNIAFLLQPKNDTAFLYDDYTLRQGLEKMKYHGYTAIPVIDRDYIAATGAYEGVLPRSCTAFDPLDRQLVHGFLLHELQGNDRAGVLGVAAQPQEMVDVLLGQRKSGGRLRCALRFSDALYLFCFRGEQVKLPVAVLIQQ